MTRPEVTKRLAIKVMADTTPGLTYRKLARLFSTSFSAVRDALRRPVTYWASMMAVAPVPSKKANIKPVFQPVAMIPPRSGARERARLVPPEQTIIIPEYVDFDVPEPEINDKANDAAYADADEQRDRVLRGVADAADDD